MNPHDSTSIAAQIGPVLDSLAAKLELPAQFVWVALIRQVYVDFAMCSVAIIAMVVIDRALWVRWKKEHKTKRAYLDDDITGALSGFLAAVATFIIGILFLSALGGILNPEYAALNKIMGAR